MIDLLLIVVEKRTVSPIGIPISNEKAGVKGGVFTENHRSQLRTQLEQVVNLICTVSYFKFNERLLSCKFFKHVQLLTQSFVGCYFEPLLQEEKEKAREMIVRPIHRNEFHSISHLFM